MLSLYGFRRVLSELVVQGQVSALLLILHYFFEVFL